MAKEALFYEKLDNNKIHCHLCPFNCRVAEGKTAKCLGRENIGGRFYAKNYAQTTSLSMDPIEKKPLYHFYPKSNILSIAANSCNLGCLFCQNWSISQVQTQTSELSIADLLNYAKANNSIGIAYTYSEPLMWYEFLLDCSKAMKENGLKNVVVSNGTLNTKPLKKLLPYIDAFNIDLKSMNPRFYKKICKSLLQPVLDNIKLIYSAGIHLEITNLIIPELNDSEKDLADLIDFIFNIDPKIPLHFSAYHPGYKMDHAATSLSILEKAYSLAKSKLDYVFIGNARINGASDTYCSNCKTLLIKRSGYSTSLVDLDKNNCRNCGHKNNLVV